MKNKKHQLFKTLAILLVLSILLALSAAHTMAASYPSKPVRLIIAVAPGGASDILGRVFAPKLSERLGKQVIIETHGGAGGAIGEEIVAKADPDGHTLYLPGLSHSTLPAFQKLSYDSAKSFTPIAMVASGFSSLVIHPSVPANSVKELIALAKQKPGQLIFVSAGVGSFAHLATELFKMMANIDIKIVQFKGGGPAMVDLLGGHSHAMAGGLSTALPHIKSGKVRVLGTGGEKRCSPLPDVPTIAEGGLTGYDVTQWFGILAPAGLPAPIVDRLSKEIKAILDSGDIDKPFQNAGVEVNYLGPAEFGQFLARDRAKWAEVIKNANIKVGE